MPEMRREILLVSPNSPRKRAANTSELFIKGFTNAAKAANISVVARPSTVKRELEAFSEVALQRGFPKASLEEMTAALQVINRGDASPIFPSRAELSQRQHFGSLVSRNKAIGNAAKSLGAQMKKGGAQLSDRMPVIVSIFMRHGQNKGDELLPEGKALAEKQGANVAQHLMEHALKEENWSGPARPAVILSVTHGGIGDIPGPIDWMTEEILGKKTEEIGGNFKPGEGIVTLGYQNGSVKHFLLRKHGIVYLHE
ncbi:MAG: hypothetical protein V1722_02395 [Candidatus Micrarchaeota archaeon]